MNTAAEDLFPQIAAMEARSRGRVLVFAASKLEIDLLPPLYDALRAIGRCERLHIVIQCRGGEVNAARRIALLLHQSTDHLTFVVPHFFPAFSQPELSFHQVFAVSDDFW